MNGEIYLSNIKHLKRNYIIHLIIYGIIISFNFVLIRVIFWFNSLLYYLYLSLSFFVIIYMLIPIIPSIYLLLKKITKKNINPFKNISIICCVLVFITGLGFTTVIMINTMESSDFCRECPFNLPNSYINNLYSDYITNNLKENDLKEQCKNRRCIFNNKILESVYSYEYICNYDPQGEFEIIKKNSNINETIEEIICEKIESNSNILKYNFKEKNIYKFLEMCKSHIEQYICRRKSEHKKYSFKENSKCPNNNYLKYLFFYCLISVILNLIVAFIPWKAEYNTYKKILASLRFRNIREESKSRNSTQNNSKIKENIEGSFKKEPTEIIIVYNETEEHMNSEENYSNKNNGNGNFANNKIIVNEFNIDNNNINKNNDQKEGQNKNNISSKILTKYTLKLNKNNNDKIRNFDKNKKDDVKIFKINDNPKKKKENKNNKEAKDKDNYEEKLVRSNSYKISYFTDRNFLEDSKSNHNI